MSPQARVRSRPPRGAARRGWDGPLERLAELGALPDGSILAHGVHLGAAPMPRAATHIHLDAIRAEATSEALRLWSRMADL